MYPNVFRTVRRSSVSAVGCSLATVIPALIRQFSGIIHVVVNRVPARLAWMFLILVIVAGQAVPGMAQTGQDPVEFKVDRLYPVRSESPITLRVEMTPRSGGLLEGKLEFKLWNGGELVSSLTTDDEVINPPSKVARYMLPTPDLKGYVQQLDLTIQFVSKQGRSKPEGPFGIVVPRQIDRDMVVGYVVPETARLSKQLDDMLEQLKFEKYSPIREDRSVRTINAKLSPDRLPTDAISLCTFNILFIPAEGFSAVKESQWTQILEWVEAGGSLCVLPSDNLLPFHLVLLNKLLAAKSPQGMFLLGPNNELLLKDESLHKPSYLARRGLGRVAVVNLADEEKLDPNSAEWRRIIAHLWNFRRDQTGKFVQSGNWNPSVLTVQEQRLGQQNVAFQYQNLRHAQRKLSYLPINSGDQLLQAIVPSNLHIIPLQLIAFVLFLYVLAIGPGDYFILGRLNLRKWTWVTFPVTTIVFAAAALLMAEWYMNTGDARRSVYFVDIGVEGQPERVNQFELLFNSRQKVVDTPLTRSLFTPLDHQMYGSGSFQQFNARKYGAGAGFVGAAQISGRMPGRYVAHQLTPKWVPQLNRILTLKTDAFQNKIDWQQFNTSDLPDWSTRLADPVWRESIIQPIQSVFTSKSLSIGIYANGEYYHLLGAAQPLSSEAYNQKLGIQNGQPMGVGMRPQDWNRPSAYNFVADMSMLQDAGLFGVISSLAPNGGRQLEDLSLLDPSDPRQWLLVVGIEEGQNWIVYRKLYAGIE